MPFRELHILSGNGGDDAGQNDTRRARVIGTNKHPLAIVIFGTDPDLKAAWCDRYSAERKTRHKYSQCENMGICQDATVGLAIRKAEFPLGMGKDVLLVMTNWGSATEHYSERRHTVDMLRRFGAKIIVAVDTTGALGNSIIAEGDFDLLLSYSCR